MDMLPITALHLDLVISVKQIQERNSNAWDGNCERVIERAQFGGVKAFIMMRNCSMLKFTTTINHIPRVCYIINLICFPLFRLSRCGYNKTMIKTRRLRGKIFQVSHRSGCPWFDCFSYFFDSMQGLKEETIEIEIILLKLMMINNPVIYVGRVLHIFVKTHWTWWPTYVARVTYRGWFQSTNLSFRT
jgi:hypothetical protein